jgi:hypothetical protein
MANKKSGSGLGGGLVALFLLFFMLSWISIPSKQEPIDGFDIASLTFANGVLSGWADDAAVKILYSDNTYSGGHARDSFRTAILLGEATFPLVTIIFNLLGAFASVGGVVAVWLARNASTKGAAFKLGFFAEIGESIAFHTGYFTTVGHWSVSEMEIGITFIVALIMGGVAVVMNKK